MGELGHELMAEVAVINDAMIERQFAECRLQSDLVRLEPAGKSGPPLGLLLYHLGKLGLGDAILKARFDEHLAVDRAVTQRLRNRVSKLLAAAGRALINRNDLHD